MAALLLGAFLAGRWQRGAAPAVAKNQNNQQIRERILLVAVGDHLERSQMVLAELDHAPDGKGKLDISGERQMAEDLLDDNRLYRQTARTTGDNSMASVLDDLERVLLEIAHSPSEISSQQLDDLREQIESRGLLFKVRVLGSEARDSETRSLKTRAGVRKGTRIRRNCRKRLTMRILFTLSLPLFCPGLLLRFAQQPPEPPMPPLAGPVSSVALRAPGWLHCLRYRLLGHSRSRSRFLLSRTSRS